MATATATTTSPAVMVNGFTPTQRAPNSTAEARQLYNQATRAFLVRDYATAATCLQGGLARLEHVPQDAWLPAVQGNAAVSTRVDLRRRLDILKVTLLATIRSSPAALSPAPHLTPLLELAPDQLVHALWSDLIGYGTDAATTSAAAAATAPPEIVPTPAARHLHPSLAVSLALAALKLDSPRAARTVAEAWFGSVGEDVEVVVADFAASGEVDWLAGVEFPLDQVAGGGGRGAPGAELSASSTLGQTVRPGGGGGDDAAVRALVGSWLKLLDLLVFHILPKLDEWDAAGDFVRLQGQENGGWVPNVRVEASLQRLRELQQEQVELEAARVQRQKDLELARAEKRKQASSPSSSSSAVSSRRSSDKGRDRTREDRNGSPAGGSSPARNRNGSARGGSKSASASPSETASRSPRAAHNNSNASAATGFAGMRDSLSTYLHRPEGNSAASASRSAVSSTRSGRASSSPVSTIVSYVRYHYATDPVRLVSFVCFVLALLTWTRRRLSLRRSRGQRGLGVADALRLVAAKVVETVGMATKVTAM
ncbi:hypothetical protein JCM3774_003142 [Rhodotorula dairenensis]